jgi:hypothetical protein
MGSLFRRRNRQYAVKMETTPGTEAAPNAATDAVRLVPGEMAPQFETEDTSDEATGSLSAPPVIPGGGYQSFPVSFRAAGSATPGTAPKSTRFLRGSGLSETLTASAVTGTAQAGSTASTLNLAVGASAVNNAYRGMVVRITANTGSGQKAVITAYNGTSKAASTYPNWGVTPDSTSQYSIDANCLYRPISVGLEAMTLYQWEHHNDGSSNSILTKLIGAMGNPTFDITVRRPGRWSIPLRGIYPASPTDVAKPSAPTYDTPTAPSFKGADCYLGGTAIKLNRFSLALGGGVDQADNPAQAHGFDEAEIVGRQVTCALLANRVSMATRDAMSDFLASTSRIFWLNYGTVAGNRHSFLINDLRPNRAPNGEAIREFSGEGISAQANGEDSEVFYCIW